MYPRLLIVVRSILGAIVRSRVGSIAIGTIGLLGSLLVVDRHQVLHVHRVLPLLVCPDADRGEAEEDGGDERQADSDPGHDVAPLVLELGVVEELRRPGLQEELGVRVGPDLVPFPMLDPVPQAHATSREETCYEHQDR